MKNGISNAIVLSAASMIGVTATAAETAQIRISGKIIPASCAVNVGANGNFDYGNIKAESLWTDRAITLDPKENSLSIDCQTGIRVALSAHDERAGTVMDGVEKVPIIGGSAGYKKDQWFGLGQTSGKKNIGAYLLVVGNTADTLDGKRGFPIGSDDSGKTWNSAIYLANLTPSPTRYVGWGLDTDGPAAAAKQFRSILKVYPALNTTKELDIKQEITLDGLATVTLHYL